MTDGVVEIGGGELPISVIAASGATPNANPEGEMDALLLGRTRVSNSKQKKLKNYFKQKNGYYLY